MNASSETWQLEDQAIHVSHLEKVYWPQTGFTKGEMRDYYRQIAPVALPHLIELLSMRVKLFRLPGNKVGAWR